MFDLIALVIWKESSFGEVVICYEYFLFFYLSIYSFIYFLLIYMFGVAIQLFSSIIHVYFLANYI